MMTSAKTIPGARLPDKRLPIDSPTNGETCLQRVIAIPRSEAVTAGQKWHTTSWDRAILPAKGTSPHRVLESIATRVFGPHRASRGPKTAGPTRPVQNGSHRKAPSKCPGGTIRACLGEICARALARPGARRAVDTPRPGGPVMRPAVSSVTNRPSVENPPPPLFGRPVRRAGVGCSLPSLTSRGTQMPYMLRFHDTDDTTEMPEPALVGHAAAWAAERGYWDVATCLMELAHALAELDKPTPVELPQPWSAVVTDDKAWKPDPRYVTELPHEPQPACSHGYATRDGVHLATGGLCDPPRWCNAPEELGGQQTCPLSTPCAVGACEIGEGPVNCSHGYPKARPAGPWGKF